MGLFDSLANLDFSSIVQDDGSVDLSGAVGSLGDFASQLNMGPTAGSVAQPAVQSQLSVGPAPAAVPASGLSPTVLVIGAVVLYLVMV